MLINNLKELEIDLETGMKNYIASPKSAEFNKTSYDYVEEQLVAAIACARGRDSEAYIHLGAAMHTLEGTISSTGVFSFLQCLRLTLTRFCCTF